MAETPAKERDWLHHFDHMSQEVAQDPFPIFDEMRAQECPVAHSDQYGGFYIPTRYEDIAAIAYNPAAFSSRQITIRDPAFMERAGGEAAQMPMEQYGAPPITSDPPFHTAFRRILLPAFSPPKVNSWEPSTREVANARIDTFIDRSTCDGAIEYAQHIPIVVISRMLGIPETDGDIFARWIHALLEGGLGDIENVLPTVFEMSAYLQERIAEHRETPQDDIISFMLEAELDGEPLNDGHLIGSLLLLVLAGIDTTWSAIGSSIYHLGKYPKDRERLLAEPELMPFAVEEFLRYYSPVTLARIVKEDTIFQGIEMHRGDQVLMNFPAANRDPAAFPDADKCIIDRAENRHYAFGVGIHRCLGSNLARMELRIALEEWLKRIPEYSIADESAIRWSVGAVRGPRVLPINIG